MSRQARLGVKLVLGLAVLLLAGCPTDIPASLLLTITTAPGTPKAEKLRVQVFDERGQAHPATPFPAAAPGADGRVGTLVIHPDDPAALSLRIQADGLEGDAVVSTGVLSVALESHRQIARTLVLEAAPPEAERDHDGDGVPDRIDNCPSVGNPNQKDGNRDGKGDACSGGAADAGSNPNQDGGNTTARDALARDMPMDQNGPSDAAKDDGPGGSPTVDAPSARALGAACTRADSCDSGNCVDGVCCDVASCGGPCRACNLPGSAGSCQNIAANADPRAEGCGAESANSCGRSGKCDGIGGCQLWGEGTPCRARSCSGTTETAAATCNGSGGCVAGSNRSCGTYSCAGDACATRCSNDGSCASGNFCRNNECVAAQTNGATCNNSRECRSGYCVDGHCCSTNGCGGNMACTGPSGTCMVRRALGATCATNGECVTGFCADGVCCNSACTDTCRRCDGSPAGVCLPITSGRDTNASSACASPRRCENGVCR
jgi:hypothetical protein